MSFEPKRNSIDQCVSSDRKITRCQLTTISEPICKDKFVKNITKDIRYEVTNINLNSIYISINIYWEGYNRYELCVDIDCGCCVCFEKWSIFWKFLWKKAKNSL